MKHRAPRSGSVLVAQAPRLQAQARLQTNDGRRGACATGCAACSQGVDVFETALRFWGLLKITQPIAPSFLPISFSVMVCRVMPSFRTKKPQCSGDRPIHFLRNVRIRSIINPGTSRLVKNRLVTPEKAGAQGKRIKVLLDTGVRRYDGIWTPAFAGMTKCEILEAPFSSFRPLTGYPDEPQLFCAL